MAEKEYVSVLQVRVFDCYHDVDLVVGVHASVKKTQKTPQREIKKAMKVVAAIERGDYDE